MATEPEDGRSLHLTEACWPVFEFITNFTRQLKGGATPDPQQLRFEGLSAWRDAADLARDEPVSERAWNDRVEAMMVYLIDYKMLNTEWEGRDFWFDNRFETDPEVLNHVESLGGDKFFESCDELQKEFELADRRDRRDKDELAEQLSLYFTCLRLGFKGRFHDRPQELADYTRRLFARLPAYASTRAKDLFPEAYQHNQEVKVNYKLGMSLTIMVAIFAVLMVTSLFTFQVAWNSATKEINDAANDIVDTKVDYFHPKEESAGRG